eukprot:1158634-Pelagomonas_calceolata.AAC.1
MMRVVCCMFSILFVNAAHAQAATKRKSHMSCSCTGPFTGHNLQVQFFCYNRVCCPWKTHQNNRHVYCLLDVGRPYQGGFVRGWLASAFDT